MKTPQALIVEDIPDLATIFGLALEAAGYTVTCVDDGLLAQSYLAEQVPDMVVLDLHLPGLSGSKLLNQIQKDGRLAQTRIIIVTADTRQGDELRKAVDLVLQKPVSYKQLRDLSQRFTTAMPQLQTNFLDELRG